MIAGAARLARRIRGRTPAELLERLLQASSAWHERVSSEGQGRGEPGSRDLSKLLASGVPHEPGALLERFRTRAPARFFPGVADPDATVALLRARVPGDEKRAIIRAERILSGRFDLLGYKDLAFGDPLGWHLDPIAARRAPRVHWTRVPYLDPAVVGDHKVVWELNRMQWLVPLGQAYLYTGDERYAACFARGVTSWLDENPPKLGINWASSLEVAFRAMSWLWALHLFRQSPALTPELFARMIAALHVHGLHIERYLSTYFSPNTHLTGEALGLVHLGLLLPELRGAAGWRELGQRVLEQQLDRQVLPDGVYFEQATQYHRYTVEFYLHLMLLARANGVPLAGNVRPAVQRMLDHLVFMTRPDGTIPLIGDDDGGRLVQLDDRRPDDVRALLALAAAMFARGELAHTSSPELAPVVWLLGGLGLESYDTLAKSEPRQSSRGFPDGGFYCMRDGWGPGSNWMVADCGPHGAMNCGHAHADALSIEAAVMGRPVIVDPGTYSYSSAERDHFRSSNAHNTVVVDGVGSSVPASAFQWARVAHARTERWISTPRFDFLVGEHRGYMSLPDPASCRREIFFLKGGYWVIRDVVGSDGRHAVASAFHLAPGLTASIVEENVLDVTDESGDTSLLRMATFGQGTAWIVEDAWVSPIYGHREPSTVARAVQQRTGAHEIVTWLISLAADRRPAIREIACKGGRAFVYEDGTMRDTLLVGQGELLAAAGVETDGYWTIVRQKGTDGEMGAECITIGARFLQVGEEQLFTGRDRTEYRIDDLPGRAGVGAMAGARE